MPNESSVSVTGTESPGRAACGDGANRIRSAGVLGVVKAPVVVVVTDGVVVLVPVT